MNTETELKFIIKPSPREEIEEALFKLFKQYNVLEQSDTLLKNRYFDSDDFILQQQRCALRIRQQDDNYQQTLKKPGYSAAGLHQHPECNVTLDKDCLNLEAIPADFLNDMLPQDYPVDKLHPIFSTNFRRHQTLIELPDNSIVEIAFDDGSIELLTANLEPEKITVEPIFEIELELKSGSINALFDLAEQLVQFNALRLGALSKAARGYYLLSPEDAEALGLSYTESNLKTSSVHDTPQTLFYELIKHALIHWKNSEQRYLMHLQRNDLYELLDTMEELKTIFLLYKQEFGVNQFYTRLDKLILSTLSLIEDLSSDTATVDLFYSAQYNSLLLDINRWMLSSRKEK